MSVGEKLRELSTAMDKVPDNDRDVALGIALAAYNLLPQIVAVIEATEDELRSEDCAATVAALAALDETLE